MDQVVPGDLMSRLRAGAQAWRPGTHVTNLRELSGGSSSVTYAADLIGTSPEAVPVVVKLAPAGIKPTKNRDVLRQSAILKALRDRSSIPVPVVLFDDAGDPPDVPPLFVMEAVPGESVEPLIDPAESLPGSDNLRARAFHAVRILASLHALDIRELGLEAEPVVSLAEELARWERILESAGADLEDLPKRCLYALRTHMPAEAVPTLVHGDFRLGNQICEGSDVVAVIDWEIWSVSDPRIDVGWFLTTFRPDRLLSAKRDHAPGLPSYEELLEVYQSILGRAVEELPWFFALAQLRSCAAMALNIKHNRRRPSPSPRIESYSAFLPRYLTNAIELVGS